VSTKPAIPGKVNEALNSAMMPRIISAFTISPLVV
jgi:hypothetical protein